MTTNKISHFFAEIKNAAKKDTDKLRQNIEPFVVSTPHLTPEEYRRRQDQMRAIEMAIDSNYPAIKTREVSKFRTSNPEFINYFRFSKKTAKEILRFDPEKRKVGLYICGKPGLGKTTITKALAIRLNDKYRKQVKFIRLNDVIDAMSQDDFSFKDEIKRRLVSCRFLFLDDLGTERDTPWVRSQIHDILDKRLHGEMWDGQRQFTFLTSNLSAKDLMQKYDDRDFRRISEIAEAIPIEEETKP